MASCLKCLMPGPDNVPELDALGGPAMEAALDRVLSVMLESTNPMNTSKWLNKLVPGEAPGPLTGRDTMAPHAHPVL